jgi:hypothetical protein
VIDNLLYDSMLNIAANLKIFCEIKIRDKYIFYFCVVLETKLEIMQAICPITDKRINERVARINALITFLLVASFIIFKFWGALVFLVFDFILRGFFDSKCSLICITSKWIVTRFKIGGKIMNAGPKIFAAQVGMVLSMVAVVLFLLGFQISGIFVASILGLFSFLESAFSFCVACKLYPLFRNIKL